MLCACLSCKNTDTEKNWVNATPIAMEIEIKEDAPLSPYPWYNSNRLKTKDVLVNRIMPPDGFSRTAVEEGSFAYWLRHLPLLKANSKVYYYNDEEKYTQAIHEAVIDIDVSEGDLQRSEDAVIRLRAEYLYSQKRYDEIVFYSKNQDTLALTDVDKTPSYKTFRQYLNKLAAVSTPLSLTESLEFITVQELQIGDVFVQPADPGHAAIVVDMAENKSRRRVFFARTSLYACARYSYSQKF